MRRRGLGSEWLARASVYCRDRSAKYDLIKSLRAFLFETDQSKLTNLCSAGTAMHTGYSVEQAPDPYSNPCKLARGARVGIACMRARMHIVHRCF